MINAAVRFGYSENRIKVNFLYVAIAMVFSDLLLLLISSITFIHIVVHFVLFFSLDNVGETQYRPAVGVAKDLFRGRGAMVPLLVSCPHQSS